MKKLFTLLSSVLLTSAAFAQIPNASFETWTTSGSANNATDWGNLNSTTGSFSVYTCDKGTTGAPDGAAYIKLTSKLVPVVSVVAPGLAVTGTINVVVSPFSYSFSGGMANTTRPASLTGKFQHMPTGADHGRMLAVLWKWNSATSTRDTVAIADTTLTGMAMTWTDFTMPLTYKKGYYPDSAVILLSSSATTPVDGSYLYVDKLAFAGTVAGVDPIGNAAASLMVYPNPATGTASVYFHSTTGTSVMLSITDISGKTIRSFSTQTVRGENNIPLSLHGLAQGMYIVKLADESGTAESKLMVQ